MVTRQIPWNKYEVALLIDAYIKVTKYQQSKNSVLIALSKRLRQMALNTGIDVDETFRNINGMQWQYGFITRAFLEEGYDTRKPPRIFCEMVSMYKTNRDEYDVVLAEAYRLSEAGTNLDKRGESAVTDNKTDFQNWLQKQPKLKYPAGLIMSVQSECSDYAVAHHVVRVSFWDMADVAQYMDAARKLLGLRLFRVMHRKTALTFDKTYIYYSSFLKEKAAQKTIEKVEEQVERVDVVSTPTASVSDTPSTVEVKVSSIDDNALLFVDFNSDEKYAYTSPTYFTYFDGDKCVVSSWKDLYVRVIQELIYDYPQVFESLKGKNIATGQRIDFSETAEVLRSPKIIRANYYVETNLSAYDIVKHIKLLLDACNVDYDNLHVEYKHKSEAEEIETPPVPSNELIRCEADKVIFEKYPILPTRIADVLKAANEPLSANEIDRRLGQACRMSTLQQILSTVSWVENVNWKYRYIPICSDSPITANIRRGDNLLARVEMLKSAFPEFVFTNMNAKGEVVERAIYIYPQGMERRGNVFFEIWHLSTEGQFDLYMKRSLLTNDEYQESLETWDKTNESRGRITRKWVYYEELIEFLQSKLSIARNNLNRATISVNTGNKNPIKYPFCEQVTTVLREHYPYGFRLESTIDIKRFRRYAEGLDLELPESDDTLKAEIKNAGVKIEDKVYLVEADTFEYIRNTINTLSSDGSCILFYDCVYDSDASGMEEHHITSADLLKAIMKHCRQNIFDDTTSIYFAKNFLSLIGEQVERDAVTLEMQRVWGDSQTRVVTEISEQLPVIPDEYVRRYLSGSTEFVWVSDGVYFSMQRFIITAEEEDAIADFVSEECDSKGYASISDIPLGNTAEENYELTDFGLQEAIYNKVLIGKYQLNGKILTRVNAASLDVVALAKQYLVGKEKCTFDEMDKKVAEYAGTRYRYMAYEALYTSMVRSDKENYVAHQYVKFDVDAIDEVLSEMISDRFVAIKEITSFALFPICGLPWNHYLLESYCYSYSKKFCLKVIGFNDKNAGIIAENDVTDGYNELLSQAAARAKIELSTEAVGQYFFETGYMGKRKFSDLESVVERAKAIREDL